MHVYSNIVSSIRSAAIVLALLAFGSGCGVIFVPPARTQVLAGPVIGTVLRPTSGSATNVQPQTADTALQIRAGFHPLQLVESQANRRWDIGAGYSGTLFTSNQVHVASYHGAYLSGSWFPWVYTPARGLTSRGATARIGVHTSAELIGAGSVLSPTWGGGASLGASIEIMGFVDGEDGQFDRDQWVGVAGAATGQGGIGFSTSIAYYDIGGVQALSFMFGATVTLPAVVAAFNLVPAALLQILQYLH